MTMPTFPLLLMVAAAPAPALADPSAELRRQIIKEVEADMAAEDLPVFTREPAELRPVLAQAGAAGGWTLDETAAGLDTLGDRLIEAGGTAYDSGMGTANKAVDLSEQMSDTR